MFGLTRLLCTGCLNPTTHEYQVRMANDLISIYIFILKISKIYNLTKHKENKKQQNKGTLAKFNPKNRNFIRNIPEIFTRLLQSPRILSGQYHYVPFMQKRHAIRLQMKKCHIISIYHKGRGVRNSKTVRNSKKSLYYFYKYRLF